MKKTKAMKEKSSWDVAPSGTKCRRLKAFRDVTPAKFTLELLAERVQSRPYRTSTVKGKGHEPFLSLFFSLPV
ncbi:MAG: hypothetical protein GX316_08485 [Firmicutes bacterium]|nr:hypothetical protein [Bacillota bacterium]